MGSGNLKVGVEWGYLKTLLNNYGQLLESYNLYLLYLRRLAHFNEKQKFICNLSSFYTCVMAHFDQFLEDEGEIKPDSYHDMNNLNDKELKKLYFKLVKWCQTSGPFATLVEQNDPHNAFRQG